MVCQLKRFVVVALLFSCAFLSASEEAKNGVLREIWRGIPGKTPADLMKHPQFQNPPTERSIVPKIDDSNLGDQYGSRYTALLQVPESGKYIFYISSDDSSELWLGKDHSNNDLSCIAYVKGYTNRYNWENQKNQKSVEILLEKGKFYFMSVLHKEDKGADFVAVAWLVPGAKEPALIPANAFVLPK